MLRWLSTGSRRLRLTTSMLFALAAVGLARADVAPQPAPGPGAEGFEEYFDEPTSEEAQALLSYYPAEARAAGVEGVVDLLCVMTAQHTHQSCVIVAEFPRGHGFGQAALGLAASTPALPSANDRMTNSPILVVFSLSPPAVSPNLLRPSQPHTLTSPVLRRRLSAEQMYRLLPPNALGPDFSASGFLVCSVSDRGELQHCLVEGLTPPGSVFGEALLQSARYFRFDPATVDARPARWQRVRIPASFGAQR